MSYLSDIDRAMQIFFYDQGSLDPGSQPFKKNYFTISFAAA
jgi:hypothetical protein